MVDQGPTLGRILVEWDSHEDLWQETTTEGKEKGGEEKGRQEEEDNEMVMIKTMMMVMIKTMMMLPMIKAMKRNEENALNIQINHHHHYHHHQQQQQQQHYHQEQQSKRESVLCHTLYEWVRLQKLL